MRKFIKMALSAITIVCICICFSINAVAAQNIVPDYEVKLLLDSAKVLNSDNLFKKDYRNLFNTGKDYETIGVLYIDTEDYDFNAEGWINRIRIKENSSAFELTYKKRYSIQNQNVNSALSLANTQGFDITDTNYDAQVDWGYQNMTLSLSCKKEKSNSGYDELELPKKTKGIEMLKEEMPGKLEDWVYNNWGKDTIDNGKKYGAVYYSKYSGSFNGIDVDIEIWPISNKTTGTVELVTEISFKQDSFGEASYYRNQLISYLDSLGILLHYDSLKTQKILNNC